MAGRRGEVLGHDRRRAAEERVRRGRHPADPHRDQPGHAALVGGHHEVDRVEAVGGRRPVPEGRARRALAQRRPSSYRSARGVGGRGAARRSAAASAASSDEVRRRAAGLPGLHGTQYRRTTDTAAAAALTAFPAAISASAAYFGRRSGLRSARPTSACSTSRRARCARRARATMPVPRLAVADPDGRTPRRGPRPRRRGSPPGPARRSPPRRRPARRCSAAAPPAPGRGRAAPARRRRRARRTGQARAPRARRGRRCPRR